MESCDDEIIFDEVVHCELPDGHNGPHSAQGVIEHTYAHYKRTWHFTWEDEYLP